MLIAHGGTVTDNLDDPQLTHIVVDPEIETRYLEMTIRTSRCVYPVAVPRLTFADLDTASWCSPTGA